MEVLIPIIAVGGFFIMIILLRQFSNKERMLMIEKGADPSQFKITQNNSWPLIIGSLAIGAGIGLVIANFLDSNLGMDEVVYPAMVFIFGGIGLIVGRKMIQKEEK